MFHIALQVLVIATIASGNVFPQYTVFNDGGMVPEHYLGTVETVGSGNRWPYTFLLNDGNRIPVPSFGTVGNTSLVNIVVKPAVIQAIEAGFRQIDTAAVYLNEEQIGEAISDVISRGIVTREELWITTKLPPSVGTREEVLLSLQGSLQRLKLDYVDLYLIHVPDNIFNSPVYDLLEIWKGMEDVKNLNLARSIGVSNFNSSHINRILANSKTVPSVNEIEVNPTFTNLELVAYCQSQGITVLSYAPFGFLVPRPFIQNPPNVTFEEPILRRIAHKYGKLPSQVVLRYLIDRGTIPIPRSTNAQHIQENIDLFDFHLTQEEIYQINELNRDNKVYKFDPVSVATFSEFYGLPTM